MRFNIMILTIIVGVALYAGSALACDTCGCTAAAAETCACGMDIADCPLESANANPADCAGCVDKGNCAGFCPAGAKATGTGDFNCACDKPIYKCSSCFETASSAVAKHLGRVSPVPDGIELLSRRIASFDIGYMTGNMTNIEDTFIELFTEAGQQDLLGDSTQVYGLFRDDVYGAVNDDTKYQAAFSLPTGSTPGGPVSLRTVPGGEYLVIIHHGAYDDLPGTYSSFLTWAAEAKIPFDARPSFEHYVSDPMTTPVEEMITEIYLPVANPHADSA